MLVGLSVYFGRIRPSGFAGLLTANLPGPWLHLDAGLLGMGP